MSVAARAPGEGSGLGLGLRLARRELRGGLRALRLVLACLALGVAAIAAVGTLRAGLAAALVADGARLLGGDLEVQTGQRPLPPEARAWAEARGARVSDVVQLRAMAVALGADGAGGERQLVELKAVDGVYPLYGALRLDPPATLEPRDGRPGLAVEPLVAERLGLTVGDAVRIGEATFALRALVATEPDKVASPALFGPRALIALEALPATALVQPGSLVQHNARLALPPGTDPRAFTGAFRAAFPDGGWRVRGTGEAAPGVNRFLDRAASFLTLAGLTALLVGGIGVATGVRAWLDRRARTIATLRCLGAPGRVVFATYLAQVAVLAAAGIAIGLAAGLALAAVAAALLAGALPVPPRFGLYLAPLALAALYGALTALAFALWPLGRALEIPGAALFRDALAPDAARPRPWLLAANAAAAAALVGLVVATAEDRAFAAWFCAAAVATLLLYRAGAAGLMAAARRLGRTRARRPALRLGLANLHRPGAPTPLLLVSLGIGLTTLAAVALIDGNLRRQLAEELPGAAPSFYFIDLQSDQAARFDALAAGLPGVSDVRRVPSLRARIVSVAGVPAEAMRVPPETAWALRGDRGLTYAAIPPEGTRVVEGAWWAADYRGRPLVSFDAGIARAWGVRVGDAIVVNVLGRDIPLEVANLRDIAWRGLGLNFTLVASPGPLEAAPHTHIATLRAEPDREAATLRAVSEAFPNVSGIRVRDALDAVTGLLGRVATALSSVAGITLLAGGLVLAGAVAAGQERRVRDAVVLKTLGAERAQIRAAYLVEFGLLGLTAGVLAAFAGTLASWGVTRFVMGAEWAFLPGTLAVTILACTALVLAAGYAGTALALRARPAPLLRND